MQMSSCSIKYLLNKFVRTHDKFSIVNDKPHAIKNYLIGIIKSWQTGNKPKIPALAATSINIGPLAIVAT